jgi:hypothetical protein
VKLTEAKNYRHGHCPAGKQSGTYKSWLAMKARCAPGHQQYKDYGGRGITICKRWLKFENFLADMGERPAGMSLDRKNNDGPYTKRNCKWSTRSEQARNSSVTKYLTRSDGVTLSMEDWSRKLGLARYGLYDRLQAGWPLEKALSTPKLNKGPRNVKS